MDAARIEPEAVPALHEMVRYPKGESMNPAVIFLSLMGAMFLYSWREARRFRRLGGIRGSRPRLHPSRHFVFIGGRAWGGWIFLLLAGCTIVAVVALTLFIAAMLERYGL